MIFHLVLHYPYATWKYHWIVQMSTVSCPLPYAQCDDDTTKQAHINILSILFVMQTSRGCKMILFLISPLYWHIYKAIYLLYNQPYSILNYPFIHSHLYHLYRPVQTNNLLQSVIRVNIPLSSFCITIIRSIHLPSFSSLLSPVSLTFYFYLFNKTILIDSAQIENKQMFLQFFIVFCCLIKIS